MVEHMDRCSVVWADRLAAEGKPVRLVWAADKPDRLVSAEDKPVRSVSAARMAPGKPVHSVSVARLAEDKRPTWAGEMAELVVDRMGCRLLWDGELGERLSSWWVWAAELCGRVVFLSAGLAEGKPVLPVWEARLAAADEGKRGRWVSVARQE